MSFRVSAAGFEGPFDLLLQLVLRQKVDIGAVSVASIADQFLEEASRMGDIDLEVASDFALVAATLLDLKAAALLPEDPPAAEGLGDEPGLTPDEARDVLAARLEAYRQFKGAAAALSARADAWALGFAREAGPGPEFAGLAPDCLEGVEAEDLARAAARMLGRRDSPLLESGHIAPRRMPLEARVRQVEAEVGARRRLTFEELVAGDPTVQNRVVSILALLELERRGALSLDQPELFGAITITALGVA